MYGFCILGGKYHGLVAVEPPYEAGDAALEVICLILAEALSSKDISASG
jgi:hypothetical protein